ncbi:ParB/RepB/Spo0J family partition protein [Candidatus Falkowbacteria bacterium]|nr:ParB/RepB/Spo0J family partition protein [Candidatus Falkowbacteria bacterium]
MPAGLGKGLGSLLAANPLVEPVDSERIVNLAPDLIQANRQQPRQEFNQESLRELADSIKECGILQPLIVAKTTVGYELIAGERRLRAAKLIGLKTVPVIVRSVDEQQKLALALIENIQRENLNPLEEALAYRRLLDEFQLTQDELAVRVGKPRSTITNLLRLLNLSATAQQALRSGQLNLGQAKVLAGIEAVKQDQALQEMTTGRATVADAVQVARSFGSKVQTKTAARQNDAYNDKGKEFLWREFFQAKVKIIRQARGGQVVIDFDSDDQLSALMEKIRR